MSVHPTWRTVATSTATPAAAMARPMIDARTAGGGDGAEGGTRV